ncbi:hypothetical protein OAK95_01935, partial [Akkermansiaceae bacterium]|nr:hypothetical protein [Akkermansiaceae bacterium]
GFSLNVDEFEVVVNTTKAMVRETISLSGEDLILDLPAGPYFRIAAIGAELAIADQSLAADVFFQQSTVNGKTETRVVITNASLQLGSVNDPFVKLSDGRGILLIKSFGDNAEEMSSGLVGTLSGSFVVNIPSVTFTGDLGIEINQTPAEVNEIFEFGGETVAISLPAGSFFKVSAKNAEVGISGQTLSGNFVFTETADLISVEVTDAELNFGGGLLVATIESGELDLFDDGIFSEMTGGVRFGSDDIKLSVASVGLKINTRTSAPAQFVRVVAEDVVVSIPGIDIRGEVLFEQVTVGIRDVVRVAISGASTQIGGVSNPLVSIRDSSAKLLILPEGIAGQIKVGGSPFNIPGLEFLVDEATLQVNTLPFAVTTEMTSFAGNAGFALPKGPFIRVEAVNATIKPLGLLVGGDDVSLSGDFLFEQRGEGLAEVTTLAASNVSAAIEFEGKNAQLVDGEGVFVLANRGLAGILSGRADIALGPIGAGGDLALRINNTGGAINKIATLGGSEISIAFSANEGNIFDVSISDLTINISDFVTISGNIRFTESTITVGDDQVDVEIFAGEDLEIFLGQGPLRIGDEAINPLAKGALLTNGRVGLIKIAGADSSTFALVASGTVELIGVDGVTISADASVRVNTTGLNIAEVIEITGSTSPGVAVNFQDDGAEVKQFVAIDATLDILGQSIQGDFDFSQATTLGPDGAFGNPDDGSTLTIEATEVNISLGSETAGVDIVKASGVLIVTEAGIAGTISGGVGVKVPGIIFQGIDTTQAIFEVSINTTPTAVDESFMVGVSQVDLNLPAGQFFRVEAEARLIVEGQSIEGRFAIESTTDAATGASLLTIRATEVEFALTSGREDVGSLENVVALTNGSGALVISDAGLAGEINGSIEINLGSDVEVQGDFSLLINNTNAAVSQDFTIAGETYTLELPFGPYVRFEATNVEVDLFNQTLAGDVTLEQVQSLGADGLPGGTGENFDSPIVRVGFNNVSINLADGLLTLDNGTGLFVVTDAGLAGRISGDVSLGVEGALLEGGLTLEVNNTGVAVDEILRAGSATLNLQIDAGQTFRISGDDVTLVIADLRLKADFEITETTIQSGAKALHVAATDLNFGMGGTEAQPIIGMTVDSAEFLFLPDGVAARVTGIAPTLNVDGVILEGTVDFELNTTTTTQLAIEDFAGIGANTVRLNADTDAEISVSGQTIEGKFSFEQVTNPVANTSIIRVTVTEAEILLGTEGAQLDLSNGSGLFLLTSYGFAAEISATVEILPVDTLRIEGKLTLQINTTGNAISETFQVGAATRTLELPSGPYFRVTGNDIILAVAGQRLSGNFVFESIVLNRGADVDDASDDTTAIRIAITNAELGLGDKDREFIHLTNGEGYFLLINKPNDEPGSGVAGKLTVDVETDLPDFEFNGTLTLELNQTGRALDEEFLVDNITQDLELDIEKVKKFAFAFNANEDTYELEEDFFEKYSRQVVVSKYFRVGGTNISIEIGEQTLQGKFAFEQQQDENGDQVTILSFDEVSLGLGDGSTDFVNVTLASGELVLLSTGVTGSFTGVVALNVPDVTMTGTATVTFDTAANEFRVEVRPPEVEPPEVGKVLINVLSQHIKADLIVIEEFTLAGGEQVVRLHITKFFLALNDGTNPIIEVTADETTLVVNSRGMGLRVANAEITADLGPNLGLIVEKANFLLNTTGAEVDLGPGLPPLPAGPYVRVEVVSGSLIVGPVTIVGGFLFDQTTDGAGNITTRIAIDQASLTVDDEDVAAADGAVVLLADGIAGNLTGSIESGGGGASVGAAVTVSINTTGREVNETIMLGDREFVIDLQKIDPNGGVSINISATVRIGDFIFLEFDGNQFSGTGKIFVGQGPAFLEDEFDDAGERVVNPSAQGFLLNDAKFTRSADDSLLVAEGTVSVIGLDGFALSGTVRLVYGAAAGTGRTLTLPGGTPEDIVSIPDTPGTIITVDDFDLEIAGQIVNGDFRFTIDQNSIEVGVENLYVGLGSTTRDENNDLISDTFITLTSSASTFSYTYTSPGFFGVLEGTLNIVKPIPNVDFGDSGLTAKLEINTTPISQEVKAAGMDITLSSGPFARVTAVIPEVVIFGSSLSGTFSFEQSVGELSQEAKDREAIDPSLAVEPPKFIKIGVTNLNIFLGDRGGVGEDDDAGLAISDGTGAFVIKSGAVVTDDQGVSTQLPGSFSGEANGTIGLSVPGVDVGFSGNFSLRVNTGTAEVQEVVQLGEQTINLNISAGPYLQVSATQLELTLLGQTLSGNFIFKEVLEGGQKILRIAASEVFIGLGDGTQDLVSINQGYAAIRIDQNGIAGAITGNFTESIPGVTIAANMSLIFNTGTVEVTETIVIPGANDVTLDVPRAGAGSSFIRFFAESIDVVIAGQTLTGNFQFEQGVRPDGEEYLKLGIQNGLLELGDGFASLNDLEGELLVSRGGVAGLLSLGASLDLGPVNISANKIIIRVNSGTAPVILDDAAATRIEGGPFFEFAAIGGNISVGGNNSVAEVVLEADFFVRKETNANGQDRLTILVENLNIDFEGIAIAEGSGTLLILPDVVGADGIIVPDTGGIAGTLNATVDLGDLVDGVELSGTSSLEINNTNGRVIDTVQVGENTVDIDLPAGPYFRIGVANAVLSIAGQSLSGSFAIENVTTSTGTLLSITALDVALSLGDGQKEYVSLTKGVGTLLVIENTINNVTTKGLAGRISGTVELKNIPGVSLSSELVLEINNTNMPINTSVEVGGVDLPLVLDTGDYIRFVAVDTLLAVAGQSIGGNFFFERSIIPGIGTAPPATVIRLGGSNINFFLGEDMGTTDGVADQADDAGLRMTGGTLALVVTPDGVGGVIGGSVSLRIPGLVETTATVNVMINNTGKALTSTFPIPNADGTGDLTLGFEAGVYFKVTIEDFSLEFFGQTLTGDFSFEQITGAGADGLFDTTDDEKTLRLAIANLSLFLGDDGGTAGFDKDSDDIGLWITDGTASLIVTPRGLAGEFSAAAAVYITQGEGIAVERVTVRINSTNVAVSETFRTGNIEQTLTLPAGPYLSVKVKGLEVELAGQNIQGDFTFIRETNLGNDDDVGGVGSNADTSTTRIMLENVLVSLSANGREFVRAESPTGSPSVLEIVSGTNGGIVGFVSVQVSVSIPGVSVGGLFRVSFNSMTAPGATPNAPRVQIPYELDDDGIPSTPSVTLEAGITVSGIGVFLDVLGQRLTGNFSFEKSAGEIVIAVTHTVLELGNGDETFITATVEHGVIVVNSQGIAADLRAGLTLSPALSQDIQFSASDIFIKINTTTQAVNRFIEVDGITASINVDRGPFIKVQAGTAGSLTTEAVPVELTILGQRLETVFFLEQITTASKVKVIRIGLSDTSLFLGDPQGAGEADDLGVFLRNGSGSILITLQGIAGEFEGDSGLTQALVDQIGGGFNTSLKFQINNLGVAVNETFSFATETGTVTKVLNLKKGPFFRAEAIGATLTIGDFALIGDFAFEKGQVRLTPTSDSVDALSIAASKVRIDASGDFSDGLINATGAIVFITSGPNQGAVAQLAGRAAIGDSSDGGTGVSAKIGVLMNTTGTAVDMSLVVGDEVITIKVSEAEFSVLADLKIDFGDLVEFRGILSADGDRFSGSDIDLFIGNGPFELLDGTLNPEAIGVLLSDGIVDYKNLGEDGQGIYAAKASGNLALIGLDGLEVRGEVTLLINTSAQIVNLGGTDLNPGTFSFVARNASFSVGNRFSVGGTIVISRRPSGDLDVLIGGGFVSINDENGDSLFTVNGSASFAITKATGFKLNSFKVNGFSIMDQMGLDAGQVDNSAGNNNGFSGTDFFPTADLAGPVTGGILVASDLLEKHYIDIQYNDLNNVGLNKATITDVAQEFAVKINGQTNHDLVFDGKPTSVAGKVNTWRYQLTGGSLTPDQFNSRVTIEFNSGSFSDNGGIGNFAEIEYFNVVPTADALPGPTATIVSPSNGGSIDAAALNQKQYIDVSFTSQDGTKINKLTITDEESEFKLSGSGVDRIKLNSDGFPILRGQPLLISGFEDTAESVTYRYFLTPIKAVSPAPVPAGQAASTPAAPTLFKGGNVRITFMDDSFASVGVDDTVAGNFNTGNFNTGNITQSFTVDPTVAGSAAASGTINIGPLEVEGPTIGLEDIGFKDGLLVLTIGIGVNRASLNFGGGGNATDANGQQTNQSSSQADSGIKAELLGVLGTFDIAVDAFGLLGGNVDIDLTGKWGLRVGVLEIDVPEVVNVTANGININYDPSFGAEGSATEGIAQELVNISEAVIKVPSVNIQGTLQGLVIRDNGFTLKTAEICYGCLDSTKNNGTALNADGTVASNQKAAIKIGTILEFDDIRIGVNDFTVNFDAENAVDFDGEIYIASGGARFLPGKAISGTLSDRNDATDVTDGVQNTEAVRATLSFTDGKVDAFKFDADTLELNLSSFVTLRATGFMLNTGANADEALVSFISVGATVKIGSLLLTGEARQFRIMGDGSFDALDGFGVFISIGSATGESFKWPSFLPIKITQIGIQWDDIEEDPGDFVLILSAEVTEIKGAKGLTFSGSITGIKISPKLLIEGKNPIIGIEALGVSVTGNLFGGKVTATLIGGILRLDEQFNIISALDTVTPVAQRVFFIGMEGKFAIAGVGGFGIRFALSELGPLSVLLNADIPITIEPNSGLTISDFTASVEFFKTLPSIDDPFALRGSAFAPPGDIDVSTWLDTVRSQVATQARLIAANPAMNGFSAAFNSPLTISGSARIYSIYTSQALFNGKVFIKISTDGKFLVGGQLNFLDDNISISGKLYADLSNAANGDVTILFLADIPDQVELLSIYGKLKMGFRNAAGDEVEFEIATDATAIPGGGQPTAELIAPVGNGEAIDSGVINSDGNKFRHTDGNDYYFVDVNYASSGSVSLDYDSILDEVDEFTLSIVESTSLDVSPIPIPVDTIINEFGIVETAELRVTGSGMDQKVVRVTKDASGIEVLTDILLRADLVDPPTEANALGKALLVAALRQTGVRRFRYVITEEGFTGFTKGDYQLSFAAGAFKHVDTTSEEGVTTPGVANEGFTLSFVVEGASARLVDPTTGANIDINSINGRTFIDVEFDSPTSGTLDFLESSITDLDPEFRLTGAGLGSITLDNSTAPIRLNSGVGHTYRYFLQGNFAENAAGEIDGTIQLSFLANAWSYTDSNLTPGNVADQVVSTPAGGNFQAGDAGPVVFDIVFDAANGVTPPVGFELDPSSLTDGNIEFLDFDPAAPGIQFEAPAGMVVTLNETVEVSYSPDIKTLSVPTIYTIADDATAPGSSFSIKVDIDPASLGFSVVDGTVTGTQPGVTKQLKDAASAGVGDVIASNDRTFIDILFAGSAGQDLDVASVLDSDAEFTLTGIGVGTATLLTVDNPLALGGNVFRYFIMGDFEVGEVNLEFIADSWMDASNETNHAFTRSYTVQGSTADSIVIRDGAPTSLDGSEIGLAEINEAGYIDLTFRPTNGNDLNHSSVNGDELILTAFDGTVISFSDAPTRISGTDTFRYTLVEELAVGVYTLTIVANSFSDSAGFTNLEEVESFTVNVARATLTNPPSGSTENREALNGRGYIDIIFEEVDTPTISEVEINGEFMELQTGSTRAAIDPDSILDEGPEFLLFDGDGNQVNVEAVPVALGGNSFRYFIQSGAAGDNFRVQFLPGSWKDGNGNKVTSEQASGYIAAEEVPTDTDGVIDIQFNGIRGTTNGKFVTFEIDSATIMDADDEITVQVTDAEGNLVTVELDETPIDLGNGRYRYVLTNGENTANAEVSFNADSWAIENGDTVSQADIEAPAINVAGAAVDPANPTRAGPYFDVTYTPIDGTAVDVATILDADAEFMLSGAQAQNLVFVDVYNLGNNTFRYLYQGQLDTGIMEVQFIEGAWADTAGNLGQASTSAIKILTESESFFIEISGGIVLNGAGFLDEPIIELSGEIIMEFDTERSVFSLDFNAQLALYKLGSVGASAGRFVIDNSRTVSDNIQIWGVAALRTNFSFLEQYGLYLSAEGTLQLNLTSQEKTETLTFKGLDGGADRTETFVLAPELFAIELVGFARLRPPGAETDLISLEGGFYLSFSPSRFELFVNSSISFGAGESSINFGESTGLLVIRTGQKVGETAGLAGAFRVSAGADIGLPDVGNIFKASGSVTVVVNTTMQNVTFQLPDSFLAIIDGDELPGFAAAGTIDSNDDGVVNEEDKASFTIYKSAPGIDGSPRVGGDPEVYATAIIQAELIIGDFIELVGFLQITIAANGDGG